MALPPSVSGLHRITLRYLLTNTIARMGIAGMLFFGAILLIRIGMEMVGLTSQENPYSGLVTYMFLPALFTASLFFTVLGLTIQWRRLRKVGWRQPELLPQPKHLKATLITAVIITAVWLSVTSIFTYRAYHFSDSTTFCGLACHQVMIPEYTAYRQSPHARVNCVECHIGPGADWFVKAKITGLHQVWAVATNTYHTPIKTPIGNLRPAQDTCEHCHWPGRFSGSVERVVTHYKTDDENTPTRFKLLMKVGGGNSDPSQPNGVHWHVSSNFKVQYLPLDDKRQKIPYVRVNYADGHSEEFMTKDFDKSTVDATKLRTMDCLDCHSRPSHIFKSPKRALDEALDRGLISPTLPGIMSTALTVFDPPLKFKTTPEAMAGIDATMDAYLKEHAAFTPEQKELADQARQELKKVYGTNFFPEQGVDYRAFIDNLGHFEFIGCDRCHDGKHSSGAAQPKVISHSCDNCHLIVGEATGVKEVAQMPYGVVKFEHPDDPVPLTKSCSSCHALNKE